MIQEDDSRLLLPEQIAVSDPQGRAALLVVESLLHALVERSVLTLRAVVDIVQTAADVQADAIDVADGAAQAAPDQALALLSRMAESLRADAATR